jgi:hypothetical protein
MFKDDGKDLPYAIFLVSMSFTAVVLTIVIVLGALGVIGV